jgi:hypothetical protein
VSADENLAMGSTMSTVLARERRSPSVIRPILRWCIRFGMLFGGCDGKQRDGGFASQQENIQR